MSDIKRHTAEFINWFLLGFLLNGIFWRIKTHEFGDIAFPIAISIIVLISIVISEVKRKTI